MVAVSLYRRSRCCRVAVERCGIRQTGEAPASLQLAITRISREKDTGDQARSASLDFALVFDRNARPARLTLAEAPTALEDGRGIALKDLLQAEASQSGDQLTLKIADLPAGLTLVNADGAEVAITDGDEVAINDEPVPWNNLKGWRLQAAAHNAGEFAVELQVISTPGMERVRKPPGSALNSALQPSPTHQASTS